MSERIRDLPRIRCPWHRAAHRGNRNCIIMCGWIGLDLQHARSERQMWIGILLFNASLKSRDAD